MAEHVLVIGATLLDTKGKPVAGLEPGTSNPAEIRSTRGGTARNVAENLARLGAEATLISAVGDDATGRQLLIQTAEAGVNLDYVQMLPGRTTGSYIALLEADGLLSVALDDVRVMEAITPDFLNRNRALFRDASLVMFDGSLSEAAIRTAVRLAKEYDVPLCADPASARLAYKLRPYLADLRLVVPNQVEEAVLCGVDFPGYDPVAGLALARRLLAEGVDIVVVTLADFGLDYATADEMGYIPPSHTRFVDSTGTGDAVTAAILFGLLNDLSPIEAIRLGAAAAAVTLQTAETVVPDLSLDMLYDHLIV
ncbi:PfkB domain protein [Candidatus Promineifilum breve]|uniref:PfkB domain protein n=1 Tax=Candidatus Promineifilum breve TaxID=1806508 RepID=A0A160T5R0_9CHLR|nr:carbohydrate kinase family protein [Candidatus Promineifilum breve]CUS04538.2 PfkB domain protein [Candidatus Promineifilum breve]